MLLRSLRDLTAKVGFDRKLQTARPVRTHRKIRGGGDWNLERLEDRTLLSGWAFGLNGTGFETGTEIALDGTGNVYVIGEFDGTVDFDPGPGAFNLTSTNAYPNMDVFVAKYSSAGALVWATQFTGTSRTAATGLALDAAGNVHVAGSFQGTTDFDPGPGVYNLTAPAGVSYGYAAKLDVSGNLAWAVPVEAIPRSLALADDGGVLTTGYFCCTRDFDPGPGTYSLTSAGGADIYVSKLDSSGNFAWAARAGGTTGDQGIGIVANSSGVYITGSFTGSADFGLITLTSAGGSDNFVSKLDAATGDFVWTRAAAGSADVGFESGSTIALDGNSNVITTGHFVGTVDFDAGPGIANLIDNGNGAAFVWKLDSSGNLVWAKQLDGTDPTARAFGVSVTVDAAGNVYSNGGVSGAYTGLGYNTVAIDFDPGIGTSTLMASDEDGYLWKLDPSGNFVWARSRGGAAVSTGDQGIAIGPNGDVFTTATFVGQPTNVDIGSTTVSIPNTTGAGLYIAKTTQDLPTTPQLDRMADSPDPVTKGGTLTLAAFPVRIVPGGSNVASISFYRDKNNNGVLNVGTDTLLGTDTNGSNGWSLAVAIPNNFKTGTYTYFAQAKDSANVAGNVVSTTNTVTTGRTAATTAVRPSSVTPPQDTDATDTVLDDLLRHHRRSLARWFRRFS